MRLDSLLGTHLPADVTPDVTSVLVGEWQVKKVAAVGREMEQLLIRGQTYLDEYFDILLHRLTEKPNTLEGQFPASLFFGGQW